MKRFHVQVHKDVTHHLAQSTFYFSSEVTLLPFVGLFRASVANTPYRH